MEMLRTILFAVMLVPAVAVKAQTPLSFGSLNGAQPYFRHFNQGIDTNHLQKKWFITKYAGISSGFVLFNGARGSFLSTPVGLQINRQLNKNVYAFAGVTVAPSYFNYSGSFYQPGFNKSNNFMQTNNFGAYSAAHLGLMYINDEKTFSISGSIGVSRSSYDPYAPFYAPANSPKLRNYKQ